MSGQAMVRILHGSHLFGTATENSDRDFKSVFLPGREDILLGRVGWSSSEGEDGSKPSARPNTRFDVDDEKHDLLRFVNLLVTGQPMALEMLFAPREFHLIEPHPAWMTLERNIEKIVSRESGKFLGYCRRQAMVYGLKGERVDAAERALGELERIVAEFGPRERLSPHIAAVVAAVGSEHVGVESRTMPGGREIAHLRIAGKMAAETVPAEHARAIAASVVKDYGERAKRARDSSGKDWKALSHALRIGYEAVELFSEGRITLPRPEAPRLLDVKLGRVDADEVGEEIVALLAEVERASSSSPLPEAADVGFLESVVVEAHGEIVAAGEKAEPLLRA